MAAVWLPISGSRDCITPSSAADLPPTIKLRVEAADLCRFLQQVCVAPQDQIRP